MQTCADYEREWVDKQLDALDGHIVYNKVNVIDVEKVKQVMVDSIWNIYSIVIHRSRDISLVFCVLQPIDEGNKKKK